MERGKKHLEMLGVDLLVLVLAKVKVSEEQMWKNRIMTCEYYE